MDLSRPIQKKYSQAMAVAAGKHMDAVIVSTRQVHIQYVYCCLSCVRYQEVSHERFHLIFFTIFTIYPNVCCQVAADCISYLKDQRIGTCCFIPLDNISPKPVQERLRSLGPKYRLCVDLVECDDIYK